MSYRETRNLLEKLRSLGYKPSPMSGATAMISMDSFRTPNFRLVADILQWLVKSYDPMVELSVDISTEHDRVHFIKSIVLVMASKGHLMLNPKRLYSADGYAVRELLKVATLLYEAKVALQRNTDGEVFTHKELVVPTSLSYDLSTKLPDRKESRMLASSLTKQGAELYDLLEQELELRESRLGAISKELDLARMETQILQLGKSQVEQIRQLEHATENLAADGNNLATKIEKKKQELDRLQKRLQSLQGVRPAFMDEYERLEREIEKLYARYVGKFRTLAYLEHQMEEQKNKERAERQKQESALKELQSHAREQELNHLRGEHETHEDEELGADADDDDMGRMDAELLVSEEDFRASGNDRLSSSGRQRSSGPPSKQSSAQNSRVSVASNGASRSSMVQMPSAMRPPSNPLSSSRPSKLNGGAGDDSMGSSREDQLHAGTSSATTAASTMMMKPAIQENRRPLTEKRAPGGGDGGAGAPLSAKKQQPAMPASALGGGGDDDNDSDEDFAADDTESLMLPESQTSDLHDF